MFAVTPAASRLGLSARAQPAKELIPALRPKWNRHNFFLHRSPPSTLLSSPLVHLSANKHKSLSTTRTPSPELLILLIAGPSKLHSPFPQPLSCSADPTSPPPSEFGQSTSTAPSCPGSPLPQLHQQKPSASQQIHLRYMYLTPNANDLRHQPPLELQPFRIPRKPCSPYFSSNG